ncbi:LacI family DNA-binding transcriptional regulator [Arthrobacter sp.]|uniref:LacI family DNA-binding transcriptional regulator n=1 Tax=Arthrobacter sp. TaxID=1667 RepID=UPI0035C6E1CD
MKTDASRTRPVPTLEMVAALAGVSRSTVSRVVNDAPNVDPDIVKSVQNAISTLNYIPNRAARSLASRRTNSVAVVVPESTSKVFADPFFATIVEGIAQTLVETKYTLTMIVSSEARPEKTRSYLLGGNVDGALVVSHHSGDHSWTRISESLPVVFAGRPFKAERESYFVEVDNFAAASRATQHLIDAGRTSIATITGPQDMYAGIDRLRGWEAALRSARLDTSLVEVGDFTEASGQEAMRRLLDRGQKIDGLFAANDQMAAGAYAVLAERNISIPADIAVVGFDDDSFATSLTPALTTIHHPIVEMGHRMAENLLSLIEGGPAERATLLPTSLVVRGSA